MRLPFPARLVPDKGSHVILAAVERAESLLPANALGITVDIIGAGQLAEDCRTFAVMHTGRIIVNYSEPVEYGPHFFKLLRGYHAILLANLQHEQPRVIFDSFAQGVPVISSATEGVREIVNDGTNALLYDIADAKALAECIVRFATDPMLQVHLAKMPSRLLKVGPMKPCTTIGSPFSSKHFCGACKNTTERSRAVQWYPEQDSTGGLEALPGSSL